MSSFWNLAASFKMPFSLSSSKAKSKNPTPIAQTADTKMTSQDAANIDALVLTTAGCPSKSNVAPADPAPTAASLPTENEASSSSRPAKDNDVVVNDPSVASLATANSSTTVLQSNDKGVDAVVPIENCGSKTPMASSSQQTSPNSWQDMPSYSVEAATETSQVAVAPPAADQTSPKKNKGGRRSTSKRDPAYMEESGEMTTDKMPNKGSNTDPGKKTRRSSATNGSTTDPPAALRKIAPFNNNPRNRLPFNSPPSKNQPRRRSSKRNKFVDDDEDYHQDDGNNKGNKDSAPRRRGKDFAKQSEGGIPTPRRRGKDAVQVQGQPEGVTTRKRARSEDQEDEPPKKYPQRRASLKKYELESSEEEAKKDMKSPTIKDNQNSKHSKRRLRRQSPPPERFSLNTELMDMSEEEKLNILKAMKRGSAPGPASPGYKAWKGWKALRRTSLNSTLKASPPRPASAPFSLDLFSPKVDRILQTLYHLLRSQMARGKIWEALETCQTMLKSAYAKASKELPKLWLPAKKRTPGMDYGYPVEVQVQELREKIAGMWCLYAHLFIQISETEVFLFGAETLSEMASRRLASLNLMEEYLWDQSIAVLAFCTSCPLAGNHAAITLSLSRLRLRQRQTGIPRPYVDASANNTATAIGTAVYYDRSMSSKDHWENNLKHALNICQAGIDRSAPTPQNTTRMCSSQKVPRDERFGEVYLDIELTSERVSSLLSTLLSTDLHGGEQPKRAELIAQPNWFLEVLNLPRQLESELLKDKGEKGASSRSPYLFADRPSTRLILLETNCLSRLEGSLKSCSDDTNLQLVCDPERLRRDPEDPLKHSKQVSSVDGVIWDDCLFFQNLTGIFIEQAKAQQCWYLQEHPLSRTAGFFRGASCQSTTNMEDEGIDGFATFPSDPVFVQLSFPCPRCSSLLASQSDVKAHIAKCSMHRFQDTLHGAWDGITTKRKPGSLAAVNCPAKKRKKVFDVEYVCQQPMQSAFVLGDGESKSQKQDCEDSKNEGAPLTDKCNAETSTEIKNTNNSESCQNSAEAAAEPNHKDSQSDPVRSDAAQRQDSQPDDAEKAERLRRKKEAKRKRKAAQRKRSINANLNGLFDVEAVVEQFSEDDGDDDECVVVAVLPAPKNTTVATSSNKKAEKGCSTNSVVVTAPTKSAVTTAPAEARIEREDVMQLSIPSNNSMISVEYPCRTCGLSSFTCELVRDKHEMLCKEGASGGCNVLVEQWPSFKFCIPSSPRQNSFPKPSAEGPLPRSIIPKPLAEGPSPKKPSSNVTKNTLPKPSAEGATPRKSASGDTNNVGITNSPSKRSPSRRNRGRPATRRTRSNANDGLPRRNGYNESVSNPLSEKSTLVVN